MHTEEYENRGFPFRDFLLKLILIIIFVFLLVWLLPKFIAPKINANNTNNSNSELSALTSQIFADNLDRMKEAAITYYTDERLPKEVGESHKMTLSDMIGKKLIVALIDKNNKACDVEASYVKIIKTEDEYILKVNLKDSEKEDYILVHLGCYTYCDSYLCEKEETEILVKGDKPSSKPTTSPTTKPTTSPTTKPTDTPTPTVTPTDKPTNTPTPTPPGEKTYIYEYQKTTGREFSEWTKWSGWQKTSCDTKEINCSDTDPNCLSKLQLYSRKEKIGTYDKKYVTERDEVVQTGSYEQKTCSKYKYIIINNRTYTTTITYTTVSTITVKTSSAPGWNRSTLKSYSNPPRDTATTKYVFAGADYSYCSDTCTSLPNYYYYEWNYQGNLTEVENTATPPNTTITDETELKAKCGEYVTTTVPVYGTIKKSYIATRKEPLYGTVCYESTKSREITDPGKTQYKWSNYNDTSLLKDGWVYTGERKLVEK